MADYSNLPVTSTPDSAEATKIFFDQYGIRPLEFAANEVDSAIAFFKGKGFGETAARTTAVTILKQAKSVAEFSALAIKSCRFGRLEI
jgi:hypothetical protein